MHTCRMTQQKPETACSRSSRHGPEHPVACMADLADVLGRDEALGERKVARVHLSEDSILGLGSYNAQP